MPTKHTFKYLLAFILFFTSMSSAMHVPLMQVEGEPAQSAAIYRMNIVINGQVEGYGTGWITRDSQGRIVMVTNAHVCHTPDTTSEVQTDDGRALVKLSFNEFDDICVLAFPDVTDEEAAHALTLAAAPGRHHEPITVIGHPNAGPRKTTRGYLIGDTFLPIDFFDFTVVPESKQYLCLNIANACLFLRWSNTFRVEIHPGSSGSPILNAEGQVIAMVWGFNNISSESLGVKFDDIKQALGF